MSTPVTPARLDALVARLEALERAQRRWRWGGSMLAVLVLLLGAWVAYNGLTEHWTPGVMTGNVMFLAEEPFSAGDAAYMKLTGAAGSIDNMSDFYGGVGVDRRRDAANLFLRNEQRDLARLGVGQQGASLVLADSAHAVYLGTRMYDGSQLLLELVTRDNRNGVRLGLDAAQQPVFEVIRDGMATSLLDGTAGR